MFQEQDSTEYLLCQSEILFGSKRTISAGFRVLIHKCGILQITMTNAQRNKQIGDIVEQKLLEFFGDPDEGLELKKSFVTELKKRMKTRGKTVPLSAVMKKYGVRRV